MTDRLLVVEDNRDILASIVDYLELKGFTVDAIDNGRSALSLIRENPYDLVVLDLGLPGLDGVSLCEVLRDTDRNPVPIIMLTARDRVDDRILGFEVGADDYLVKPFALPELYQRIKAVLKRVHRAYEHRFNVGALLMDTETQQVSRDGELLKLDRKGFQILKLLMKRYPGVVTRDEICHLLWGDEPPDSGALKTHIYRLRQAVDQPYDQPMIQTVPGLGYKLVSHVSG